MLEDPDNIDNVCVKFFLQYHKEVLASQILIPMGGFLIAKTYNSVTLSSAKQPTKDLKEPLLPTKAEGTASADQICMEQVVTSDNSIQISFNGKEGDKGDL